jgi:hypothetical protein
VHGLYLERAIAREGFNGKFVYRMPLDGEVLHVGPPVKDVAIPDFDETAARAFVLDSFTSGATASVTEVYTRARSQFPHVDRAMVERFVSDLVEEGAIVTVPLGSLMRYRRSAVPA